MNWLYEFSLHFCHIRLFILIFFTLWNHPSEFKTYSFLSTLLSRVLFAIPFSGSPTQNRFVLLTIQVLQTYQTFVQAQCPIVRDNFWETADELSLTAPPPFKSQTKAENINTLLRSITSLKERVYSEPKPPPSNERTAASQGGHHRNSTNQPLAPMLRWKQKKIINK